MKLADLAIEFERLQGAAHAFGARVTAREWRAAAESVAKQNGRLLALWGSEREGAYVAHMALVVAEGAIILSLPLDGESYPDVSDLFAPAIRMQRAAYDLLGLRADGASDTRQWLRHGAWPAAAFPLRKSYGMNQVSPPAADDYEFVPVTGDGVHEIPVGPVHAGTIEPGHFRFSILGERVMRLEERLGYKHKGIEKRFEQLSLAEGARLAGRVSGDSTVAYAWAYAMAVEAATGTKAPARAAWLRALFLERERIANHLGDLGFLGNDAGLAFGLAQFSILKENMLRLNAALFGHRYLMDLVMPGGVARDVDAEGAASLEAEADRLEREVTTLRKIYDEHAGLQDRFITAGRVTPELAAQLGLVGLAGRASSQMLDVRTQHPHAPYDVLKPNIAMHPNGDVAARVAVRFDEVFESLRLQRRILELMPAGETRVALAQASGAIIGAGWIEGWRGESFVALEAEGERIRRCHVHDPSWQNWPVLEHAVIGNIVPDFPLINKSFNLSYSGHDL